MSAIFISYRREDSQFATDRIYEHLTRHFDRKAVFKDVDNIPYGVNFRTHIAEAVAGSKVLLAVIGPDWLETRTKAGGRRLDDPDDFVRIEIEAALARGIQIMPALVGGATMPPADGLPKSLRALAEINAIRVRADPDFTQDVQRLRGALSHAVGGSGRTRPGAGILVAGVVVLITLVTAAYWMIASSPKPSLIVPAPSLPSGLPSNSQQANPPVGNCRDVPVIDNTKMPAVTRTIRVCD